MYIFSCYIALQFNPDQTENLTQQSKIKTYLSCRYEDILKLTIRNKLVDLLSQMFQQILSLEIT